MDAAELLLGMLKVSPRLCYNRLQLFLVLGKRGWKPGNVFEKWWRELLGAALETLERHEMQKLRF